MNAKPKLVPVKTHWSVAADAEFLQLQTDADGFPVSVTFVGRFLNTDYDPGNSMIEVTAPGPFRLAGPDERKRFHLVRVNFEEALGYGWHEHPADWLSIDMERYDLSEYPVAILEGEADVRLRRIRETEERTGFAADPFFYEISGSAALKELAPDRDDLRHYLILGSEKNLSIIARGFTWEMGQSLD